MLLRDEDVQETASEIGGDSDRIPNALYNTVTIANRYNEAFIEASIVYGIQRTVVAILLELSERVPQYSDVEITPQDVEITIERLAPHFGFYGEDALEDYLRTMGEIEDENKYNSEVVALFVQAVMLRDLMADAKNAPIIPRKEIALQAFEKSPEAQRMITMMQWN